MGKATKIRILAALLAALLLYAAVGFLLAPRLVESRLKALCEERLGQPLTLERLRINPFALSAEGTGVRLEQQGGPPAVAARRIYLNFDLLSSGFGRGWVLAEAQADGLQGELAFAEDGRSNFAQLVEHWNRTGSPAPSDSPPPRVVIKHLLVSEGALTVREGAGSSQATEKAVPIRIELFDVATLPDKQGRYSVSAQFQAGGSMTWQGDLGLTPLRFEGELSITGLPIASVWQFFRDELRIAKPAGTLDLATRYRFGYSQGGPDLSLSAIRIKAAAWNIAAAAGARPLLAVKDMEATQGQFQLTSRELVLPLVRLHGGELSASMSARGTLDWGELAAANARGARAAKSHEAPWRIRIEQVQADQLAVHYEDLNRPMPLALEAPSLRGTATVELTVGEGPTQVLARGMNLHLQGLALAPVEDRNAAVRLGALGVEGARLDLAAHAFSADRLAVQGGTIPVLRAKDGSVSLLRLLQSPDTSEKTAPWNYALNEVRIDDLKVSLSDRSFGDPIGYELTGVSARMNAIARSSGKPMVFQASARLGQGSLGASGSAAQDFSRADARLKISGLALVPLQPLVTRYADVALVSGRASADARVTYRSARGGPSLNTRGAVALDGLQFNEAGLGPVLAWKRLSADDVRFSLAPDRLAIRELVLEAPETRIAISEQRDLNLAQLLKKPDSTGSAAKTEAAQAVRFPVNVGALRVRDGAVDFSDVSLVLPFSTRVTAFQGSATGISSDPGRRAALEFQGEIGEFGAARVKGSLNTASPSSFTDIQVSFENVPMPPLSPYSATFLGRKIASGDLWMDLDYKIVDRKLAGDNKITARNLTLGEPVKSPSALDLPLDLVIALLTDSQGRIATAIPVSGDLGNPNFAIGPAIRTAFANLVRRIVSAPFRALAGLFGRGSKAELDSIGFEAGSASLPPSEREKLQEVANVLRERPQLRLVVQAAYDPERDAHALREDLARREVAKALQRAPQAGEPPGPIAFDNPAAQRALERLLSERDRQAADSLAAEFARRTGKEPRRVGFLFRSPGDADFYRAVFDRLVQAQSLPQDAGGTLAMRRAQAVTRYLQEAGIDPARLETATTESKSTHQNDRVSARLSLQAAPAIQHAGA